MGAPDPRALPEGLPAPEDDGAAAHLPGMRVPDVALRSTDGGEVSLARWRRPALVVVFPWAGRPGEAAPAEGWDAIPGARGCTSELCGFRDVAAGFGGRDLIGLSAQPPERQGEVAQRLALGFQLLSDEGLELAGAMRLPTFDADGRTLLRRLTMLIEDGEVLRVWYPGFPPGAHAEQILSELGLEDP